MTANELAEFVEKWGNQLESKDIKEIATMLRQQQAEIEALKLRELTDEEIIATFNYFCAFKDESKTLNPEYFEEQMILYAQLILETASRKANENEF